MTISQKFHKAWENRTIDTKESDYTLITNNGYATLPSEYANMSMENIIYTPTISLTSPMKELKKPNTDIISIDKLNSLNPINHCYDYSEAHGSPAFLQDSIPQEYIEKYQNPENIEVAFQKKCKEMKNIL